MKIAKKRFKLANIFSQNKEKRNIEVIRLFLITISTYILLPIIIFFIPSLFEYKFYILTIVGILLFFLFKIHHVSSKDLGIKKENAKKSLKRNLPFILLSIIIIIILKMGNLNKYTPTENFSFYLFYIIISCPFQEFIYRGIFGYFEKNFIKNKLLILFLSSLCYSLVHIIYKDILTCLLTFILGIILYLLYRKDYNLLGVCLSHIILGILTIYLGIIN